MALNACIFDIGNVLVRFEPGRAERNLARLGDVSNAKAREISALGSVYERGGLERGEFLGRVRGILGHAGPDEDLVRAWQEMFSPNVPMWELVEKLHGKHPLYLLSNTNCLHHEYLVREYPIFEKFADGVFSYRARMSKPERGIFELAIRQFGVDPQTTAYIDDLGANVEAARAAGLLAFQYDPDAHEDLVATLRAQGLQSV